MTTLVFFIERNRSHSFQVFARGLLMFDRETE